MADDERHYRRKRKGATSGNSSEHGVGQNKTVVDNRLPALSRNAPLNYNL